MPTFKELWKNHVGHDFVCDETVFKNQCAIRMGEALRLSGVSLAAQKLRTCFTYNKRRFKAHLPGHVLAAQQLADVFKDKPELLAAGVVREKLKGNIHKNLAKLKNRNGMIFIHNGWGATDHIDLWNGKTQTLKGGYADYFHKGVAVWFWEIP